ncbi:MAG: diaminopimelate epimerase [Solirubrobacteraceae bacterium]
MDFEKWQALGNDYLIVEARGLPFELTPARVRAICAAHTGVFADGILLLSDPDRSGDQSDPDASGDQSDPDASGDQSNPGASGGYGDPGAGCLARLTIYNSDGSPAELSGNGAREAVLYLRRRGWTERERFSIKTAAGEIRARITSPSTCTVDMGRARLRSADYPSGPPDGIGQLTVGSHSWRFQHVKVGNPQCAIVLRDEAELIALVLGETGPQIEHHELFPQQTNVSWFTVLGPGRIRARIFERGVGETSASGTGAIGAAVAYVLGGGDSPVVVVLDGGELEVDVGEDLHIHLSGWALPVFRGTLADELVEELHATQ